MNMIENVSTFADAQMAAQQEALPTQDMVGQDAFLKLLVAQMQNQDPLNPQSNEDFVAQLAQFSSLEQLMGVNSSLDSLYAATTSMNNAAMTQLLGRTVMAYSDDFDYSGTGEHDVWFNATADTTQTTLTITDVDGKVVAREELGAMSEGEHSWTWDGKNLSGGPAGAGTYDVTVSAKNQTGTEVEVYTMVYGEVDGMSYETGIPIPSVAGTEIQIGDILRVETYSIEEDDSSEDEDAT